MEKKDQIVEKINNVSKHLDENFKVKNVSKIISFFSNDCEIVLLDMPFDGKEDGMLKNGLVNFLL